MRKRQRKKNAKKAKWRHFGMFISPEKRPELYVNGIRRKSKFIGVRDNSDLKYLCRYLKIPAIYEIVDERVVEWSDKYWSHWRYAKQNVRQNAKQSFVNENKEKIFYVGDE